MHLNLFMEQARRAFTALNNSVYEKNMHALEIRFPAKIYEKEREQAAAIVGLCQRNGVVAIIRDDVGLCVESGADGVMLSQAGAVEQAKHILGERAIIGVDCGNSTEKAELALAGGADYVIFSRFFSTAANAKSASLDLLEWWNSKTMLPSVALGNLNVERALAMTHKGAGFIGAGSWVWNHREGPARAIYWLLEAIEHGLPKRSLPESIN